MPIPFRDRIKHAWNAFRTGESTLSDPAITGVGYSKRPDKVRLQYGTERSIISAVYTRIGIDVAAVPLVHARVDQNGNFLEEIRSSLNECLTIEANKDQTGRALIQDLVMSLCDEGHVAIVPVDTTINPMVSGSFDVLTMRAGRVIDWYPDHIRVNLYNDQSGQKQDVVLRKKMVAIVENPFFAVMNEYNSTLKRLVRKLNLLDAIDEQSGSGKLDIMVQLPYVVKTDARKQLAEKRRQDIEDQLQGSKYGIAYIDGAERITQLNRPTENNMMGQIEFLTNMLYSQLGLTEEVFLGNADEKTMLNYYNRTIEPILAAISDGMTRSFITKTGRTQGQRIIYMRDSFRFVPVSDIATIADTFTRNAIFTSNEVRSIVGFQPNSDPEADKLSNKNLNSTAGGELDNNQNGRKEVTDVKEDVKK